jgi:hypothetical protein
MYFATDAAPGQNLYYCTTGGAWTRGGGGASASSAGACQLASSLGFALNGTDESALLNSTFAAFYAAGGGCLAIDMGKTLRADSQIVLPHAGAWPYGAPTYRITSGGNAGGGVGAADIGLATGVLDLRFHGDASHPEYGNGPKLVAIGDGAVIIDNVTLTSTASGDCAAYLITTNAQLFVHNTTFWGQQGAAGCSTAIVMGGPQQGTLSSTGNITDHFGGYGTVIRDNRFLYMGRVAWLRSGANGVILDTNFIQGGNSTTLPNVFDWLVSDSRPTRTEPISSATT